VIAFSHYSIAGDIGGVTTWLADLLSALKTQGQDVALNLHGFDDDHQSGMFSRARAIGLPIDAFRRGPTSAYDVRRTLQFLNACRASVYLPQCLPSMHYAARIAQRRGLPWIFTLHSDDPVYWAMAEHTGPSAGRGVWVAVSREIGLRAREQFPKADVRIIPYGVVAPPDTATWCDRSFRVVYVGRLVEYQKRISLVIEAMIRACLSDARIECRVIGDGEERAKLESKVAAAGLQDRIRFTGRLDGHEVTSELLHAHAMILMSDYEGLPVALLEAMAAGVVPVVRNIRSGIPELVRDGITGFLCDDDPQDLAEVLSRLANDRARWATLSCVARSLVLDGFSREASIDAWIALIREMKNRSSVRYPLPVARDPNLPIPDSRLATLDFRRPQTYSRWIGRLRRLVLKMIGIPSHWMRCLLSRSES
jgi:colanic acid/amylovoran biosynthesis glycosyltransferase